MRSFAGVLLVLCSCTTAPEAAPSAVTSPFRSAVHCPRGGAAGIGEVMAALDRELAREAAAAGIQLVLSPHGGRIRARKGASPGEWVFTVTGDRVCAFRVKEMPSEWQFEFEPRVEGGPGAASAGTFDGGMRAAAGQAVLRLKHGPPPR